MENLEGIIQLLTLIVDKFKDAYSRPDREIELYDKYRTLRRTHRVRITGSFLVIDGGRAQGASEARLQHGMGLKVPETRQNRRIAAKGYSETGHGHEQTTI